MRAWLVAPFLVLMLAGCADSRTLLEAGDCDERDGPGEVGITLDCDQVAGEATWGASLPCGHAQADATMNRGPSIGSVTLQIFDGQDLAMERRVAQSGATGEGSGGVVIEDAQQPRLVVRTAADFDGGFVVNFWCV